MYHIQTSLFYDLQELNRNSSPLRKYYCLFQVLDLSIPPDRNYGVSRTGHSQPPSCEHSLSNICTKSNPFHNYSNILTPCRHYWNCAALPSEICRMNRNSIVS